MMDLESEMGNYQHVKELVLEKLVSEGLLSKDDANEFDDRCQVLTYKGTWFSKWFDRNLKKSEIKKDKSNYYMTIIEMYRKQDGKSK